MTPSFLGFSRCILISAGIITAIFFILISLSADTLACPLELPTTTITVKDYTLTVELATTPTARNCGLAHRDELAPDHGMLFVFPNLQPRAFWMKDTKIPLSLAFLNESAQILNIQRMTPLQTDKRYRSDQPTKYALEVNQGWFVRRSIEVGDTVEIELPIVVNIK